MTDLSSATSRIVSSHANALIAIAVILTGLLVVPMLYLSSNDIASMEPGGPVFDLRDEISSKLASNAFVTAYIAEARDGDMLRKAPLLELLQNERALIAADTEGDLTPGKMERQSLLLESFHTQTKQPYRGVLSIADAVDVWLRATRSKTLAQSDEGEVKIAISRLLSNPRTAGVSDQLSVLAASEKRVVMGQEIDYWVSPGIIFAVRANNDALGGTTGFRGIANDETGVNLERFARNVQRHLRGDQVTYELWGLAIDQTLTAEEQGRTAGTFILLTVIGALAVVGISLRSYWATALTAVGIGALMIWLKGFSALVGIKGGLIVDLIVPIAMVSLGVDFAVHAARRYQEERRIGLNPKDSLRIGMAGVIGALLLAMLSDAIAFLSNVPSGIEAVVHFGIAAGIAVAASFTVLGIVLPLALMRIDEIRSARHLGDAWPRWVSFAAAMGVVSMTGTGVILLVAVDQAIGTGVLLVSALVFVAGPVVVLLMRAPSAETTASERAISMFEGAWLVRIVATIASHRVLVLPLVTALTIASIILALRLEATFDVKDVFSSDSDLVIGLDKLDAHVGDRTGEAGIVFLGGDLTNPKTIVAIESVTELLKENEYVGTELDGEASIFEVNLLGMITLMMESTVARSAVLDHTGTALTDRDNDGWPDTAEQLRSLYRYMTTKGVPLNARTTFYSPEIVRTVLHYDDDQFANQTTVIYVGIPGTREQSVIAGARDALRTDIATLKDAPGLSRVGLTGSPFIRDAELNATVNNLRRSLPIAAAGALLLLLLAFRSLRFAIVTIVPIGLVVVWLYAIMELAGFALNFVTATIGAVSIGVGIDYSIHMTERYREEWSRSGTKLDALKRATSGTGVALLASAGSSVVGFAIMGFAPMPMFSTYGILTAVMISLALVAALLVLPSLLMLITSEPGERERMADLTTSR